MSKCKAVQDERKVKELCVRKKENGSVVEKKLIKSSSAKTSNATK